MAPSCEVADAPALTVARHAAAAEPIFRLALKKFLPLDRASPGRPVPFLAASSIAAMIAAGVSLDEAIVHLLINVTDILGEFIGAI